ncbi:hypothetical protein F511_16848 [Dorcoceras hygrometricum]|uniref:Uncharacterized protein n=1 Tax=Dorcoceras hygrometricum TaxID=472368 RepID=A0A2Z7CEZ5_9LAMI|nr:hypothetical protein F511_16848 [Dorcoceras hygrometricum]
MASALINNTVQVYFASILSMDHEGIVSMFEALVASGLSGFLGCSSALFEAALVDFLHNASVRDGIVVSTVQGKPVSISEELFASTFELPMEGLTDLHEVSQDLILEVRRAFSYSGKLISTSCKKREMVYEFRLLNDILAKSVTVKAGSFDAVTHERFLMVTAIFGGVPVNWGRVSSSEESQRKNYWHVSAQKQENVDEDEPVMEKPEGKKKAVSKKRPAPSDESPVTKRKKTTGKDTPAGKKLALVTVAQEAVPIQIIPADTPFALKCKTSKKRLRLPAEPLAQLRALVNQMSTERVQMRNDSEKLQDMLLMEIRSLDKKVTEILIQQDSLYRGLDDIRKDVDETKAALSNAILEFHAQAQENYNNLSSQLGELVAYINRGGNDKKGEGGSSSRETQPPPGDREVRPGSGNGDSRIGSSGRRFYISGRYRESGRAGHWLGEK